MHSLDASTSLLLLDRFTLTMSQCLTDLLRFLLNAIESSRLENLADMITSTLCTDGHIRRRDPSEIDRLFGCDDRVCKDFYGDEMGYTANVKGGAC